MFSLTLDTAKNIGIGAVVLLAILALVTASVIRNVTVKIITIALVVGIGVAIWSQRTSVQNCADRAKARIELGDASGVVCTFFGRTVNVPTG